MSLDWVNPDRGPTPEQLAAYCDGELSDAARAAVEEWLLSRPEAGAEIDALRRLSRLTQTTAPREPDDRTWAALYHRVEAALPGPRPAPRTAWPRRVAAAAAAAAAVLAVGLLARTFWLDPKPPEKVEITANPDVEPYPVVAAEDVRVISMHGGDAGMLVVAGPPVADLSEDDLARPEDVTIVRVEPYWQDGIEADLRLQEGAAPMIAPPVGWQRDP